MQLANQYFLGLEVGSVKRPRYYNPKTADPFSRLRVPKYLKSFEVVFFFIFLFLYYSVLVERNPDQISVAEVLLYIWLAAFFYDELSEWSDAGSIFYITDVRAIHYLLSDNSAILTMLDRFGTYLTSP